MTAGMGNQWLVGRGIADVTGEPWGVGMMGYGMPHQRTNGIISRQFARAFVLDDGDRRVAFVVADIGMFFQAGVAAIHERLGQRFAGTYGPGNVVLTATHTHCGPGGHGHDVLYNITTAGHHSRTFARLVDGVVEAIARADADLAPSTAILTRATLHTASANRARSAFDRDPAEERAVFPDAIDPATLLLRFERAGRLVGAINWFAVHNTSMTNSNRLISADNKGWAAYSWERRGADPQGSAPELVTAFAQTNSGDLSPNLELRPGRGPTDDEVANTAIIGARQLDAARELAEQVGAELTALIDVRHRYLRVAGQPTPAGPTGRAILGASFAAGKLTDGPGSPLFDEGKRNPVPELITKALYRLLPGLARAQAPKDLFLPIGPMRWAQETYLLQLVRWGQLYLICLPFELTIVAGLRMRRAVATELGVELDLVVVQGYANGYGHYVTTPEEYDEQLYEGGATVFGRNELDALRNAFVELASALREGRAVEPGTPPRPHRLRLIGPTGSPRFARQRPVAVRDAPTSARSGQTVTVRFDADHPNAVLRPTYFRVERQQGDAWQVVADDASTTTTITWHRDLRLRFGAAVTWVAGAPGTYRITYLGSTEATTPPITVSGTGD
ncbi:neutral/alkaline non-lysosomal ceramidase N-terminal domain-containing protein [Nocardia sp. NPDC058176]|uniref:neutral/alkaline non-lysosomal ceramidase N-terminal domain-containing protein n=1 Tax=Nocardia sp. NPDC058176 TaxID=3346368 RepID=UPI0036DB58E7